MLWKNYFVILILLQLLACILCQEPVFDIPVQLIGFPVIALSVRLANFAKKLMYSLNPGTYKSISKRSYSLDYYKEEQLASNIFEVKNSILKEFGENACIEEDICKYYSENSEQFSRNPEYMIHLYHENIDEEKKWKLLSAFVGSIIKQPNLCSILQEEIPCRTTVD